MNFEGPGKQKDLPWTARRLRALRRETGTSRPELARKLHVRLRTLETWEQGRGKATAYARPKLEKLERQLGNSQEMKLARKSGAITLDEAPRAAGQDAGSANANPPVKRGPRLMTTGATAVRMREARLKLLNRMLALQGARTQTP